MKQQDRSKGYRKKYEVIFVRFKSKPYLHDLARMNIIQQINRAGTSDVDYISESVLPHKTHRRKLLL